ncbi:MAG: ABC transporter substrate-binding protein [Alphaproteobacteria bacterium]
MAGRRIAAGAALAALVALAGAQGGAQAERIAISCGALGIELRLCTDAVERWQASTGHEVTIVSTPNSSTERLALYQQLLAAQASDIDVLQIDVVWPGILAPHLIDLRPHVGEEPARHFPAIVANNTVAGRLVAMPWWTDAGVLYYRADLLEKHGLSPPRTWEELVAAATRVQAGERAAGPERIWGFVWQGRAYEGIFCNALEWIASYGGGTVVDADGSVTIDNPQAARAFRMAQSWIGTISPKGVLSYDEEAARGVFQTGRAVFMRNWPYAWALAQSEGSPVRGKVGVTALPKGGAEGVHAGTLGGWNLAVSRYSRHPRIAADLVRFMTGPDEQKRRALQASYNPTIEALYDDPEIVAANPFFATLRPIFESAVARPSRVAGRHYNRLSSQVWRASHDMLARGVPPAERLPRLAAEIERLARRGGW